MKKVAKLAFAGMLVAVTMLTAGCYGTATKKDCTLTPTAHDYGVVINGKPYITSGCDGVFTPYDPTQVETINQVDQQPWSTTPTVTKPKYDK